MGLTNYVTEKIKGIRYVSVDDDGVTKKKLILEPIDTGHIELEIPELTQDIASLSRANLIGAVPKLSTSVVRPLYDDFTASDNSPIVGRTAVSGHVWEVTGPNVPVILGNSFSSPGTSYIYTDIGEKVSSIECQTLNGTGALMINKSEKNILEDVIHLSLDSTGWVFSLINGDLNVIGNSAWENIAKGIYPIPLVAGSNFKVRMTVVGDTAILELPGNVIVAYSNPKIAKYVGNRPIFEIFNQPTERWSSIRAAGASSEVRVPNIPMPVGENLLSKTLATIDNNTHGWFALSNAEVPLRIIDRSSYGAGALAISSSEVGAVSVYNFTKRPLPNGGSRWYTLHMDVQMPGALSTEQAGAFIFFVDSSDESVLTPIGPLTPLIGDWRKTLLHCWPPSTATQFVIAIQLVSASAPGRTFYVDKLGLIEGLSSLWLAPSN